MARCYQGKFQVNWSAMNVRDAQAFVRRHLGSIVVVLLVLSPAFFYLLHMSQDMLTKREQFDKEMATKHEQFDKEIVRLEQKKAALDERDFIVTQKEDLLQQREKNLAAQALLVEQKSKANAASIARLQQEEAKLSLQWRQKQTDDHIEQLASEISNLGGLNDLPSCDDAEGVRRRRSALSKFEELAALAEAGNELAENYMGHLVGPYGLQSGRSCFSKSFGSH